MKTQGSIRRRLAWGPRAMLASSALLAACGGGGDAGSSGGPGNGFQPPANPIATATCGLPDFAATALARVNQWRASGANCGAAGNFGPAAALAWSNSLALAAASHTTDMQQNNFFSHTGSSGSTLAQRIDAVGYSWSSIAENIAAGQATVVSVVDGWIASPGHCANIMNPDFRHVGLACVQGNSANTYPTYWTMTLGKPR